MAKKDFKLEKGVALVDKKIFGDNKEHYYTIRCFDGYAVAKRELNVNNEPRQIKLVYPSIDDVINDKDKCREVIDYCNIPNRDINVGDIMLCYGRILPIAKVC